MTRKKIYLKAEHLYKYILGDDELETLIMCKPAHIDLVTTDQSLYEALGAVEDKESIRYNKLVKLLENVDTLSLKYSLKKVRAVLTDERVQDIRKKAEEDATIDLASEERG